MNAPGLNISSASSLLEAGGPEGPVKIAVMGAGAVGCYYGGMLARAGHPVALIGRPSHVAAIERDGLRLEAQTFDQRLRVTASSDPSALQGAMLVLFCVKSTDTESAAAQMRPHLAPGAVILTLQNGVDNAERLRTVLPHTILSTVVYVATEMAAPGHVKHHGRGELVIEPSTESEAISRMLIAAGVPTEIFGNVRGALWAKLILNSAYNALSAITQLPYGRLGYAQGVQDVIRDVVAECVAVAEADGVRLPGQLDAAVARIVETMPSQYSSTAQDLARGKASEIDHLNGYVLRRGAAHGISTPVNRVLHTLVKLLETSGAVKRDK
ncbi:2-dehydropantoate 2-reductase [Burkholderiales bacterium 8X]|nr:2-dehydropantoate 2-reductase [Burkholderiales bacterium 8X]